MNAIALAYHLLPSPLIARYRLRSRRFDRGGEPEVQFRWSDQPCVLPVWLDGHLTVVRWGTRRGESQTLPVTGWTWQATVEAGSWKKWGGDLVDIPVSLVCERGVWIRVRQGLRGVLAREGGELAVYVVCEPASHYYNVMTRAKWMPVLIGERI